jgi:lipoprotein-releasing system permease protein
LNLPLLIARRNLLRQQGNFSSFIIRIAIAATGLSVAVMIAALAIVGGFQHSITEKLYAFEGHIHIHEHGNNTFRAGSMPPQEEDGYLEEKVAAIPHVKHIAPYIKRAGILQYKGKMEGMLLKGIPKDFYFSAGIEFKGRAINYSDTAYSKEIQLSQTTADRLDLKIGDTVQLYFLEEGSTFPRIRKVRVAGLYHTGMDEFDKVYGLCDIRLLQHVNNWEDNHISGYQVNLDDEQYDVAIADKILTEYLNIPLYSYTMSETYSHIYSWLGLINMNSKIILTIMAIVAIINLAVALLILIVEQARMVGVLKAQGMGTGQMRRVFVYYAGLIAGIGILAGNIFALGLGWLQNETGFIKLQEASYYMRTVPFRIVWWQVLLVDSVTLLLCMLCMLLPTLYLRRVQPAKVLQFK